MDQSLYGCIAILLFNAHLHLRGKKQGPAEFSVIEGANLTVKPWVMNYVILYSWGKIAQNVVDLQYVPVHMYL